jgi:hypothetical protein
MANAVYPKWKEEIAKLTASAGLNGSGATGVFAALIDSADYTYSSSHEFYSSISSAIVGTPQEIGSKTFTDGVFDGADVTFPSVTGDQCEAIVLYIANAGANTTWRLFAYIDTGFTGMPVTPNGGNIGVAWNASGIVDL